MILSSIYFWNTLDLYFLNVYYQNLGLQNRLRAFSLEGEQVQYIYMTPNGRSLLLSENSLFSYLFWRTFIFVLKNTFICSEEPICSEENSYLFWRTPPWFQLDLSPAVWRSDIAMGQIYFTIDSGQKKINNDTQGHYWINTHTGKYSRVLSKLPERIKIIVLENLHICSEEHSYLSYLRSRNE